MGFAVNQIWKCVSVLTKAKGMEPQAILVRQGGLPGKISYEGPWAEEFQLGQTYRLISLGGRGDDGPCTCDAREDMTDDAR